MDIRALRIPILIFLLLVVLLVYFTYYKPQADAEYFPVSKQTSLLNHKSGFYNFLNQFWDENCANPKNESLVLAMRITKRNEEFDIECEYGPQYTTVVLNKEPFYLNITYPVLSEFATTFTGCNEGFAEFFYNTMITNRGNHFFPIDNPLPPSPDTPTDYYAILLACRTKGKLGSITYIFDPSNKMIYG